jgi:HD domain-containing protein
MMRSSPTGRADSATRTSPAARTVITVPRGVNSGLTKLSTKADGFYERYRYPDWLETHSRVVGAIAESLVGARRRGAARIDAEAVILAAYLHDIGRSPLLDGDGRDHNILSGLVLSAEGLEACVEPARRHAIYTVLDPELAPRTAEEKLVYVADHRGGQAVETLEERARDTARRNPKYAAEIERAIPLAKTIEQEVFSDVSFAPNELAEKVP